MLVAHLKRTKGFTLDALQFLVIDEADLLLLEDFQDWISVVSQVHSHPVLAAFDFTEETLAFWCSR